MGPTETDSAASIIELAAKDIADGLLLSREAGWNQSTADWSMMLRVGKGFGIRDRDRLVATGLALPHPPLFGWVSMVLVTASYRRRGLATRLLKHAIDHLTGRSLMPMLDATPAGRPVYLLLGFCDIEPISRWRRPGNGTGANRPGAGFDVGRAIETDRAVFGADRSAILSDIAGRPGAFAASRPSGAFLLTRAGTTATQIGPIVADTSTEAVDLLDEAIGAIGSPLLIDVPDRESELSDRLQHCGFRVERPFTRMALGRTRGFGEPASVRAIAGPELG